MLKVARVANAYSAHRVVKLWAGRYLPDLSGLPTQKYSFPATELIEYATPEGRSRTVKRLRSLLLIQCELAGLEANSLFTYIPNIINLSEARRIAPYVKRVYEAIFDIYQQQNPPSTYLKYIDASSQLFNRIALPSLMLPAIQQLFEALDPVLLQLQDTYVSAQDPRTIAFLTTQFHFTTKNILQKITPCEQILITPYLNFVEEQICIPWQRVCAAAAQSSNSETLALIERLLPETHAIASRTFERSVVNFTDHISRRGKLTEPGVAASTLRDLNMFQGYLHLCLLEQSMNPIEHELLPLCLTVFPNVSVRWDLVRFMLRSLELELFSLLTPAQIRLLSPYTQALQSLFVNADQANAELSTLFSDQTRYFSNGIPRSRNDAHYQN